MGDRVSISFVRYDSKGRVDDESVALFDHWGGTEFPKKAAAFVKSRLPFTRSPSDIIVPFLLSMEKSDAEEIYFGRDPSDGDNSDNGHFRINTETGECKRFEFEERHELPNAAKIAYNALSIAINRLDRINDELKKELEKVDNVRK